MTPAQLARTVAAHLSMHDRIWLPTMAADIGAPEADVAAVVRQMAGEWRMLPITLTIERVSA